MAPDARIAARDDLSTETQPDLAELLDPVALEERLKDARLRRAAALERRRTVAAAEPGPATSMPVLPVSARRPLPPLPPSPSQAGAFSDPFIFPSGDAPAAAVTAPALSDLPRRALAHLAAAPVWLTFVAGLALGAAGVAVTVAPIRAPGIVPEPELAVRPSAAAVSAAAEVPAPAPASPPPAVAPVFPTEIAALSQPPRRSAPPAAIPAAAAGLTDDVPPADLAEPAVENAAAVPAGTLSPATLPSSDPPAPDETSSAEPSRSAIALPPRAAVHFPRSARRAADMAAAALRAQGIAVEILPVELAIARTNVRFYHDVDQAGAERVSTLLAEALSGEPPLTRDFTSYAAPTSSGKVEIWLAGGAGGWRASAASTMAAEASEPVRPAASGGLPSNPAVYDPSGPAPAVVPQSQAEEIARIVIERAYQRLLQEAPAP